MKCDRCKEDFCMWTELTSVDAKSTKPELGFKNPPGGGKCLFCKECQPVVMKNKGKS